MIQQTDERINAEQLHDAEVADVMKRLRELTAELNTLTHTYPEMERTNPEEAKRKLVVIKQQMNVCIAAIDMLMPKRDVWTKQ